MKVERGENQEPIELINISDSEDEGPRLEGLLRAAGTSRCLKSCHVILSIVCLVDHM